MRSMRREERLDTLEPEVLLFLEGRRCMASILMAEPAGSGFAGLNGIYQFVNDDGLIVDPAYVCGQAACATLLAYRRLVASDISSLRSIERNHPPNLFFGRGGTSPSRIQRILAHYGANSLVHVDNKETLKSRIRSFCPVVCLIQNSNNLLRGAHWFVVFAYNDTGVFVTNYSPTHLTWDEFEDKWGALIPDLPFLEFKGITFNFSYRW